MHILKKCVPICTHTKCAHMKCTHTTCTYTHKVYTHKLYTHTKCTPSVYTHTKYTHTQSVHTHTQSEHTHTYSCIQTKMWCEHVCHHQRFSRALIRGKAVNIEREVSFSLEFYVWVCCQLGKAFYFQICTRCVNFSWANRQGANNRQRLILFI